MVERASRLIRVKVRVFSVSVCVVGNSSNPFGHTSLLRSGAKPIVVEKFDFSCAKCNL